MLVKKLFKDGHLPPGVSQESEDMQLPQLPSEAYSSDASNPDLDQLVVCEYLASTGQPVNYCAFMAIGNRPGPQSYSIPIVTAQYTYEVREARTGRLVTTFNLPGGSAFYEQSQNTIGPLPIPALCSASPLDPPSGPLDSSGVEHSVQIPVPVDDQSLADALRPFIG